MKRHLIGVGGVGMSALATVLIREGFQVSGSDRNLNTPNIAFLKSIGVEIFPDDGSGVDDDVEEVVFSTAIESDNPGLVKARSLGIRLTHRAQALASALSSRKLIAVVGTAGKSTVTAMLGHILAECGFDPLCVNGANVPGWTGAVRPGRGGYAVAEVDESDRSLVVFSPYAAIITNASDDHYSKAEMDEVFDTFSRKCSGPVIDGRSGRYVWNGGDLPMPGRHNRENAALAVSMAVSLGADEKDAIKALGTFRGVERRLQRYGDRVYDDYAHNPEKLRAMWQTLGESGEKGICVVWRPHGYGPLRKNFDGLVKMFSSVVRPQDRLLLLPVYDAGGTADRSVDAATFFEALAAKGVNAEIFRDYDEVLSWIAKNQSLFGIFATCGARDPMLPELSRQISEILI